MHQNIVRQITIFDASFPLCTELTEICGSQLIDIQLSYHLAYVVGSHAHEGLHVRTDRALRERLRNHS